jgi:hypothetical protein
VLEQFVYALCREDATPEQADRAFTYLCKQFYDWNEVRVSSTRELVSRGLFRRYLVRAGDSLPDFLSHVISSVSVSAPAPRRR